MSEAERGSYSVVASALRHAVVGADAWTLRSYAVVATLVSAFVSLLFLLAFPEWVLLTDAGPLQRVGRAFLVLVGLAVVATTIAPLLFVDRRRRTGRRQRQFAFGIAGYAYLASLYLALLASAPADARSEPSGVVAPVVDVFYAMPPAAGVAIVLAGAGIPLVVEYWLGREDGQASVDR